MYNVLRKAPHKINESTVNPTASYTTPINKRTNKKAILAATCLLIMVALVAFAVSFSSSKSIVYASTVKGLGAGIYWDQTCTNRTLTLGWGRIEAGSNNTLMVYVKNEGNSTASLSLKTSNWTPSAAANYMHLDWNYSGQVLNVNQVISLQLTLTVDPTIKGVSNFSFDTSIATSEH